MAELDDTRSVVLLLGVVLVATAVASFGFNALSTNPLVPNATLIVSDAPEEWAWNRSGTVEMATVRHAEGETLNLTDIEVVVGSRAQGLRFNASNDWSTTVAGITYDASLNGAAIATSNTGRFEPGDTLTIRKVAGTRAGTTPFEIKVRVFHRPSSTVLAGRVVEIS